MSGFVRWELRTVDVDAARAFYDDLLTDGAGEISVLPEVARARGARPHWLGHLATTDVPGRVEAFVARGATSLSAGLLRDPSGAVLALTTPSRPNRRDVVWTQLMTDDPSRAKKDYGDLFGMTGGPRVEVPDHGVFELFGWSGAIVGSVGSIVDRPQVHPQWLFFFLVRDLEQAMHHVASRGGLVIGPNEMADGRRVAVCDDPQGAAFGLLAAP